MRTTIYAATAAIFLLSAPAQAQGTNHDEGTHFGLGAAFNLATILVLAPGGAAVVAPFSSASILIPIDILGVVRIEPELNFGHTENTNDQDETDSASVIRPGLGVFFMFPLGDNAGGYVGARGGPVVNLITNEQADPLGGTINTTDTRIDGFLAPAFGGEYYFSKHFSLGAEIQVAFTFIGDVERDVDPGPDPANPDESGLIVGTNALLTARIFFF
jgi:hypothetical protein